MKKTVGLFRVLTFEDLDLTARLLNNYEPKDVYDILNEKLSVKAKGSVGRRKLINNLMMVWGNGQKKPAEYQRHAMKAYLDMKKDEQIVLQYLMMLIAFPFLAFEATFAGKYLRLHNVITSKTFNYEVLNAYGNSDTIKRSITNGLGILREFGFLTQIKPGTFNFSGIKIDVKSNILKNYIALAVMSNTQNEYLTIDLINNNSMMYGLEYYIESSELAQDLFEVSNERLDTYIKIR